MRCDAFRPMIKYVKDNLGGKLTGLEIGVASGVNAENILQTLDIKKLYLVDPYQQYIQKRKKVSYGHTKEEALQRLHKYGDQIVFLYDFSDEVVDNIPGNLDFVYIDGNHDYKYVKEDINLYAKKLNDKGILCGHDFDFPDVARAVTEFASKKGLTVNMHGYHTDWVIKNEDDA